MKGELGRGILQAVCEKQISGKHVISTLSPRERVCVCVLGRKLKMPVSVCSVQKCTSCFNLLNNQKPESACCLLSWRQAQRKRRERRCPWCWRKGAFLALTTSTPPAPLLASTRLIWLCPLCIYWLIMIGPAGGERGLSSVNARLRLVVPREWHLKHLQNDFQCCWDSTFMRRDRVGGPTHTNTHTHAHKKSYLYSLAVVDFHHVEVKTVNPFARCDEITSLLVKIPPNVY